MYLFSLYIFYHIDTSNKSLRGIEPHSAFGFSYMQDCMYEIDCFAIPLIKSVEAYLTKKEREKHFTTLRL